MRRLHFETFQPVCPDCRLQESGEHRLEIGWIAREEGDTILEGALRCTNPECRLEYPILDGLPILLVDDPATTPPPDVLAGDSLATTLRAWGGDVTRADAPDPLRAVPAGPLSRWMTSRTPRTRRLDLP